MFYLIEAIKNHEMKVLFPSKDSQWHDSQGAEWLESLSVLTLDALKEILAAKNWTYLIGHGKEQEWLFTCPSEYEMSYNGFFHKIVEHSHDEIYVCDGEGRTLYCNKTFESNYGLRREDMIGKTAMYLIEQGYSDQSPIPEVIRTHQTVTMNQKTVTGKNLMITATPHLTKEDQIAFIVENCRDTTELETIRQQLEKKSNEAERYKQEAEQIRMQEASELVSSRMLSLAMRQVISTAERVAATDATVLILGESGSGKSFIAKNIHQNSRRKSQPFICINCSTIAPSLFESELFGYASGAFTGASSKGKIGQIALAEGGTLFLDEIGEVPQFLQAKLLELIQEKRYLPVGGIQYKTADVRIIAATNRDLQQLVIEKHFREDLFYRLKVVEVSMPPLRECIEDIDGLLDKYLEHFNREYGYQKVLNPETRHILNHYHWPGNIRELQNLIHNLVIMALGKEILPTDLPGTLIFDTLPTEGAQEFGNLDHLIDAFERAIVMRCFEQCGSSYKVAKVLQISQSRASRLIRRHCSEV